MKKHQNKTVGSGASSQSSDGPNASASMTATATTTTSNTSSAVSNWISPGQDPTRISPSPVPFQPYVGQRGSKGGIVVDGYIFQVDKATSTSTYYKCANRSACRARFVVRAAIGVYTNRDHSHPNHGLQIAKSELKHALKEASCTSFESYRAVFDSVCNRPEHRNAAPNLVYSAVQGSMRNARSQCFPRTPKSASDFHYLMMTEKAAGLRTIYGETFYYGCVGEGKITLFFVVPATINALREAQSTVLFFDGTYKTRPSMFCQLFMAYAEIGGKVFPLAFMPSEIASPSVEQYVEILKKLLTVIPPVTVTGTCSDFEKSLINACRAVFKNATHQGCLFHFKQAVRRYIINKMGVQQSNADYAEYRIAMQLPHLPADKIAEGVQIAIRHIKGKTRDREAAESFENYLRMQWLRNINPHVYSTYHVEHTSNNAAESYHSKMLREIGVSPAAWIFVEKIIAMAKTVSYEIGRVQSLPYRREQSDRQKLVLKCTHMYDSDGDILKFLISLNTSTKNFEFGCIPVVENEALEALEGCIICTKSASISLAPCMHKPYCGVCAWKAVANNNNCPICESPWSGLIKDAEIAPNLPCKTSDRHSLRKTSHADRSARPPLANHCLPSDRQDFRMPTALLDSAELAMQDFRSSFAPQDFAC
ncbi:uncharacterized protein LOC135702939 [Ochlerotatus camptorhynchus]|uniref:uncharacterized protein LOC135702939 n=1 Tax=Ochlerotatus camptorhynchus TaxID=644619 RepID=UPI0031D84F94